jgi:hypothetical protein
MIKKVFLLVIVFTTAVSGIQAQVEEPNRVGIIAGYNLSGLTGVSGTATGGTPDWGMVSGFRAGLAGEFPLAKSFYLQPALLFTSQGFKDEYTPTGSTVNAKRKFTFYQLQIPINVQYKLNLGIPKIIFQIGPYAGYGLFGRQKYYRNDVSKDLSDQYKKLSFGNNKKGDNIRPAFDYGVGAGVGVQIHRFQVLAGYNYSLGALKFEKNAYSRNYDIKGSNNVFFASFSFFFGRYPSLFPEED